MGVNNNDTGIVSQVNINDIINAANKVEASKDVLLSASKTIDTLIKSFKDPTKTLTSLDTVKKLTVNYCDIVNSLVETLVKKDSNDNIKNLADLLGRTMVTDPKDSKKRVEKWTVVDAALQIPNILNTVFKVMESVSSFNFNKKQIKKMKQNIITMQVGLTDIFDTIFEVFENISGSKDFSKILKILVSEPDTVTNIIQNDIGDKSVNVGTNSKTDTWDKSITNTTTKHGKMGLLDAMEKIFALVGVLTTLKAPNLLLLRFRISRIGKGISMVYKELSSQLKEYTTDAFIDTQIKIGALLAGDDKKDVPGLADIFMSVGMIFNKIKDIKFNWVKFKLTQFAIRRLLKLTTTIIDATNLPEFKEFTGKVIYDKLDKFTTTLKKLCSVYEVLDDSYASILLFGTFYKKVKNSLLLLLKLAQTVKLLSSIQLPNKIEQLDIIESVVEKIASIQKNISFSIKFFIVGWLAFRLIRRFIKKLPDLIRDINILCAKVAGINVVDNGIKNVNKIITAITDIQKNVILSALLFIPASIGLLCMIGFTYLLILFVNVISKMAKGDSFTKVINIASKNILNITKIIMALVIVAASILTFTIIALVLSEIIKYTLVPTILLLVSTIIFIFVAMLFAWGISKLAEKISKNVAINIIMITGCFIIAALAILVAAIVGEKFRSGEVWANLGIGISVIILVSTAMVGLGIALSFAAPFMAMATAGMTPLLVALGMMLAAGLTIVAIGAMSFDFGKFEKGTNPKEGQFGKGTKSAGNLGLLFEFVQFLVAQIGSGYSRKDKKTIKKANKVLKRVKTTVKTILFIGEQLNTLQKLTFNADVITANVKNIFSFVGNLETKITEFLNPKSNVFGKTTIKNIISAAKSKRKRWKKSGKALSRVEKTIAVISDIATTLLTLKDFNFDEDKKDKNGILKKGTKATILNNIESLLSMVTEISDKINNAENLKSINDNTNSKVLTFTSYINTINDSLKAIADLDPTVSKTYVDNYIRFIDKVNTIDVEKAQKTTQLFEQMAKFSASIKGDFDKLAEALNEKMLPVLEELKDIMGKVPEKLDTGFANTSASISAANAPATVENVAAQLNRENPDKDKNFIEKLLDKRMAEKAQQEANSTTAKLDELITLLKGFGPQVAVVKTV